jgi:hypothetical protein
MTPKEKADKFVKKMYAVHSNSASDITLYFAKQCALIAVDEIIINMNDLQENGKLKEEFDIYLFWLDVKKEIQLL